MICHGGAIAVQRVVGLGNAALDLQALLEDLGAIPPPGPKNPFVFSDVRGTYDLGKPFVSLMRFRNPDLTFRKKPLDLPLPGELCEDVPAWWLLKKKKTMYHTGIVDARSVRSLMQFLLGPLSAADMIKNEERAFADVQAY